MKNNVIPYLLLQTADFLLLFCGRGNTGVNNGGMGTENVLWMVQGVEFWDKGK